MFTRSFMVALRTSEIRPAHDRRRRGRARRAAALRRGAVRRADPGQLRPRPHPPREAAILVVADATDPVATGAAIGALQGLSASVFSRDLIGPAASLAPKPAPDEVRIDCRYNPTGATRLNIVPGLMGTILTLTMLIFTVLSVTREIERGTTESLLRC